MKALFGIPVSKLLISGVIASTFLTVSCQKRGTRPLNAGIATEKTTDSNNDSLNTFDTTTTNIPTMNPHNTDDDLVIQDRQQDKQEDNQTAESGQIQKEKTEDSKKSDSTTVVVTKEKKDEEAKTEVIVTTKKEDKKSEESVVVTDTKKQNESTAVTKKEETTTAVAVRSASPCTETAKNKATDLLKIYEELKVTTNKDQFLDLAKTYVKTCGEFGRSINNHKNKSCDDFDLGNGQKLKLSEATFSNQCMYFGYQLQTNGISNPFGKKYMDLIKNEIKTLKATTFKISNEALALLKQESNDFKLFTLNGEIKSDATILRDTKNIACSFTNTNLEIAPNSETEMKVLSIEDDVAAQTSLMRVSIESKNAGADVNDRALEQNTTLACKHLSANHFHMMLLQKSLGDLIKVAK